MSNGIGIREMAKHNNNCYCMASSASGQDGPNRLLWLATQPGKMSPIARFDWLPERARWTQSLALIGYPSGQDEPNRSLWLATRAGKMNPIARFDWLPERARWSYLVPLLTKLVQSRWLDIGLVLFFTSLWTLNPSRSITRGKRTWPISSHLDLKLAGQ